MAAAGAAVAAFGALSVREFMASEDAAMQLNAVLKSTGGVAGVTAEKANDLASSLQKVTKFSDEAILGGENLLLTFTNIGQDIFPQATEVMLDMSQALGQDVKSSAIQLGKALQDPILGVTALRRVGVNFSEAQQDVIKNLVETGRAGEAQAMILKELQTEFGGSAKAAGQTLGGQLEILKNKFSDVMETIGGGIATVIRPAVIAFSDWLDKIGGGQGIMDGFGRVITFVKDQIMIFINNTGGMSAWIERMNAVTTALKDVWQFLAFVWVTYLAPAFNELWVAIRDNLLPALVRLNDENPELMESAKLLAIIMGGTLLAALVIVAKAITFVVNAVSWLIDRFREASNGFRAVVGNMMSFFGSIISGASAGIVWIRALSDELTKLIIKVAHLTGFGAQIDKALKASVPGRAAGGPVSGGQPYIVGEKGPELFVPGRSGSIVPNNELATSSTNNTTININVGLMTGSAVERRDAAAKMFEDLKDIASSRGMSVGQMIGAS